MAKEKGSRLIANNKKAYHDYFIEETYEAGIALHGTEVKSLRMGKCSIKESFVRIENEEVYIYGMHISPYEKGNIFNRDPLRVKKLLLHKSEIRKMKGKIAEMIFQTPSRRTGVNSNISSSLREKSMDLVLTILCMSHIIEQVQIKISPRDQF